MGLFKRGDWVKTDKGIVGKVVSSNDKTGFMRVKRRDSWQTQNVAQKPAKRVADPGLASKVKRWWK